MLAKRDDLNQKYRAEIAHEREKFETEKLKLEESAVAFQTKMNYQLIFFVSFMLITIIILAWSVGICTAEEIDALNIHQATLLAMKRAIESLNSFPSINVMVDGLFCPKVNYPCEAIVKGDAKVAEISAASIIAKTERDLKMIEIDKIYPGYQFKKHKGYPTKLHVEMIKSFGICEYHRKTFSPIKEILALQ